MKKNEESFPAHDFPFFPEQMFFVNVFPNVAPDEFRDLVPGQVDREDLLAGSLSAKYAAERPQRLGSTRLEPGQCQT
jgi:hypothetical protein